MCEGIVEVTVARWNFFCPTNNWLFADDIIAWKDTTKWEWMQQSGWVKEEKKKLCYLSMTLGQKM